MEQLDGVAVTKQEATSRKQNETPAYSLDCARHGGAGLRAIHANPT
jgi:hypothetical protein